MVCRYGTVWILEIRVDVDANYFLIVEISKEKVRQSPTEICSLDIVTLSLNLERRRSFL
jgi:hypothetical protein